MQICNTDNLCILSSVFQSTHDLLCASEYIDILSLFDQKQATPRTNKTIVFVQSTFNPSRDCNEDERSNALRPRIDLVL